MPTYLCHGFRWHRPCIRTFNTVEGVEEVAVDWITRPETTQALIDCFYRLFPMLPTHDLEADAEAEVAAQLAAQEEAAHKAAKAAEAAVAAAAAEERGRSAVAAFVSRSKSKSRRDKKVKDAKDAKDEPPGMPGIPPSTPGAAAFAAAVTAMTANIKATPPGRCPLPVLPANVPEAEKPGVPPPGVRRRGNVKRRRDKKKDLLARQDHSAIKLLEEFDPARLNDGEYTRPYAYVADYVARIDLSVSVVDEMARYERLQQARWRREHKSKDGQPSMGGPADEGPAFASIGSNLGGGVGSSGKPLTKKKAPGWFEIVRDNIQRGEEIRWYIVVNNDEERSYGQDESDDDDDDDDESKSDDLEEEARRKLREELCGDPEILLDDPSDSDSDDEGEELNTHSESTSTSINDMASTSTGANGAPATLAPVTGRPRGTTTSHVPPQAPSAAQDMEFPLPPQPVQEQRRPHTSSAPSNTGAGSIDAHFLSDFPAPPQLAVQSSSRQLPQRQSHTPNFSTPHSPPAYQQQHRQSESRQQAVLEVPPMPPVPVSPPVSPTPPQLRNKKSFDLRPKSSGGSGLRRLFGRSKEA